MTFKDIFKKSFLEGFASTEITTLTVVTALGVACLLALYIFFVYRVVTRKTFYSKNFNITLAGVTVITSSLILTMQSSVVLSLGMVGALSIVRFRAAIKEPIEIVFLFWAIAAGIVVGAGMIPLAVIGSAIIGLILIFFAGRKTHDRPYILVLNCTNEAAEAAARDLVKASSSRFVIKSKVVNAAGIELTAEVRVREAETAFVNRVNDLPDVTNASLVSYNGDYMA